MVTIIQRLIRQGTNENFADGHNRRLIYTNIIYITLPFVYTLFVLIDLPHYIKPFEQLDWDQFIFIVEIVICATSIYLNKIGHSKAGRLLFILSWPLLMHIIPIWHQKTPTDYYLAYPVGLIFHALLIHLMFSRRTEAMLFWPLLIFNFVLVLTSISLLLKYEDEVTPDLLALVDDKYFFLVIILYYLLFSLLIFLLIQAIEYLLSSMQFKFNNIYYCGLYGLAGQISKSVGSPENPGYIVGPKVVCLDDTKTYKVANDYFVDYQWASTTANIEGRGAEVNVKFPSLGIHNLSLKLVNACGVSESRVLSIDAKKIDEPIISGPETLGAGEANVKYSIANHNPSLSYSWSIPQSLSFAVESADPSSIRVNWRKEIGKASVSVIAANRAVGCRARGQLDVELEVVTGLEANAGITVYPNPTRDDFFINTDHWTSFEGVLLNTTGQRVLEINQLSERVSLRTFPPGLYFLRLQNPNTGNLVTIPILKI